MTKKEIEKLVFSLKSFRNYINTKCYRLNPFTDKVEKFNPYNFQMPLIQALESKDNLLINSARQMGISTILQYFALFTCIQPGKKVIYITHNQASAISVVKSLKQLYDLSFKDVVSLEEYYQTRMLFENDSYIIITSANIPKGKSEQVDLIIMDNAAFCPNLFSIFAASVICTNRIIIASTPKKGSYFNVLCSVKKTLFNKLEFPWHVHDVNGKNKIKNPNYNLKNGDASKYTNEYYAENCSRLINIDSINEELNCKIIKEKKRDKNSFRLNLRLPSNIIEKLNSLSAANNVPISKVVREALTNYFNL